MAIITDTSPVSLSAHVPIAPPAPQQQYVVSDHDENDEIGIQSSSGDSSSSSSISIIVSPSRHHEPIVILAENDKENNSLRGRRQRDEDEDDDILHTPKKRRKTSSTLPSPVTPSSSCCSSSPSCGSRGRHLPSSFSSELKQVLQSLQQKQHRRDSSSSNSKSNINTITPLSKNQNLLMTTDNKSIQKNTKTTTVAMKPFSEDYYSVLKYEKSDEEKKHDKKLRFTPFTQVKEIPSFRDYAMDERNAMYSNTREIRENAKRNTKEMWHDIYAASSGNNTDGGFNDVFSEENDDGDDTTSRGQLILEHALEEDAFHIYHLDGDSDNDNGGEEEERIEFIHPATYPQWLREQKAKEELQVDEFYRSNETSVDKHFHQFYYGNHDDDDDDTPLELEYDSSNNDNDDTKSGTDAAVAAAVAAAVKTYEDEHSTVFRFGGGGEADTSFSYSDVLEFDADYGMDDFLVSSWKSDDDEHEYL